MTRIIGISGSRHGMTGNQHKAALVLLSQSPVVVHHGDCEGVDEEIHEMARFRGYKVIVHPPADHKHRAYCAGGEVLPEDGYRERNLAIVNACEELWAFPEGPEDDHPRSGTWMTVRMARRKGIPVEVVLP